MSISLGGLSGRLGLMVPALIAVTLSAGRVSAAGVRWADLSLEAALARARAEKKWVLVDLGAPWCAPCRSMDQTVYSREDVARAVEPHFIALRLDGEQGEGKRIYHRYHVVGFPTLLVLDAGGREIDRIMGFRAAPALIATLADLRAGRGSIGDLERRVRRKATPALLLDLGKRHALRGDARAVGELERAIRGDPDNQGGLAAAALLVLGKYYFLRGKNDPARAAERLEELRRRFPKTEEADEAPYHLAIARHRLGDDPGALAVLDAWVAAAAPPSAEHYQSYVWCCAREGFGFARAREVARMGIAAHPDSADLWDALAELERAAGDRAAAAMAARRASELSPGDAYRRERLEDFRRSADSTPPMEAR